MKTTDTYSQVILTETDIAQTKKLRPQLEAMVGSQKDVNLPIHEWGRLIGSLCGARQKAGIRKRAMTIARRIARSLAEAVGFEGPPLEI